MISSNIFFKLKTSQELWKLHFTSDRQSDLYVDLVFLVSPVFLVSNQNQVVTRNAK